MYAATYGKDHELLKNDFLKMRETASGFIDKEMIDSGFIQDQEKAKKIQSEFSKIPLYWPTPPKDEDFEIINGEQVLKEDVTSIFYQDFQNKSPINYEELNAFYMNSQIGLIMYGEDKEEFALLPQFMLVYESNPLTVLTVMAHEVGHKLGPQVSKINKHNLTSELAPLMKCLKKSGSIKMSQSQEDEVFADWFSANIIAQYIQKNYPEEQFQSALVNSVKAFCSFEKTQDNRGNFSVDQEHPNTRMRIQGIYASNPFFKKVFGCENNSKYISCGLKGEL